MNSVESIKPFYRIIQFIQTWEQNPFRIETKSMELDFDDSSLPENRQTALNEYNRRLQKLEEKQTLERKPFVGIEAFETGYGDDPAFALCLQFIDRNAKSWNLIGGRPEEGDEALKVEEQALLDYFDEY